MEIIKEQKKPQVSMIILKTRENESTNHCYNSMNIVKNNNRFEFDDEKITIDEVCGIHVQVKSCTYDNLFETLLECNTMYACVVKSNVLVEENFLPEMLFYYENIKNAGAIYLVDDMTNHAPTPMPTNDDEYLPVLHSIVNEKRKLDILFFQTFIAEAMATLQFDLTLENIPFFCAKSGRVIFALSSSFIIKK